MAARFTTLEPISLYEASAPGSEGWTQTRREYFSDIFGTEVVANVTAPTLTPVIPDDGCGTAALIAPGGAFHALSIDREGFGVARWLAARGIAAFVLEYRLIGGGDDPVAEILAKPSEQTLGEVAEVAPLAGADASQAMRLIRTRAAEFGVDPSRVGCVGFSAGGNVALRIALDNDDDVRPNFIAPIYTPTYGLDLTAIPAESGPMFLAVATNDQLGMADEAIAIYQQWKAAGRSVELHVYAEGGHGFGVHEQGLPSDSWIERFGDWLRAQHLLEDPRR